MKNAARAANVAEPEFELSGFFKVMFRRKLSNPTTVPSDTQAILGDRKQSTANHLKIHKKTVPSDTER
jgi:hypothetical protein